MTPETQFNIITFGFLAMGAIALIVMVSDHFRYERQKRKHEAALIEADKRLNGRLYPAPCETLTLSQVKVTRISSATFSPYAANILRRW